MRLYHGSNLEINEIDLKKSMVGKDFGQGFYLSADYSQAAKQANNTTFRKQQGEPTVTVFLFDEKLLDSPDLKVKIFEGYTEEWAEFILLNRSNRTATPAHDYDIVYGPIANDTVGVQIRRYMERYINMTQFIEELKYLKGITFQYFFGTERAIKLLTKE